MAYHHHYRHYKKTLKRSEKIIFFIVLPATIVVALTLSFIINSLPTLYRKFVENAQLEEDISREIIRGSAVRRETSLRQQYESKWREDSAAGVWDKHYETILQNKEKNEIKEVERLLKEQPLPIKK